ncbi:Oxidoreductase [Furfurilactobacillus rossiae]|uniref:NADPH-dependent FMN reductase n=1 Tax=Furfurilactobacillus rossiae TaxID=231049 RepID=UPI0015C080A6|nr:NADPH-dependent FMN reductase [Furfurilactobacillus rossiae]MCF6165833.1 NAD(P)H-dependent oxidoreductase [Furfurilactobacillus rossiae]QLE64397.1 Oxidoreductase [Furfurilactobacillus rossiae]
MKSVVCINGGTATDSYNKLLTRYIASRYSTTIEWSEPDIMALPLILANGDNNQSVAVTDFLKAVASADAVVIATPEYNNATTAGIKNALDWCSFAPYPLSDKPTLLMGASTGTLGTVRAQQNVREILQSAMLSPRLVNPPEILLGHANTKFDDQGNLMDHQTLSLIDEAMHKLIQMIEV